MCAGLFLLALTYHLGARSANAQAGSSVSGFAANLYWAFVITPNGDCYARNVGGDPNNEFGSGVPIYMGNFWGGAVSTQSHTLGQLKARFRSAPAGK